MLHMPVTSLKKDGKCLSCITTAQAQMKRWHECKRKSRPDPIRGTRTTVLFSSVCRNTLHGTVLNKRAEPHPFGACEWLNLVNLVQNLIMMEPPVTNEPCVMFFFFFFYVSITFLLFLLSGSTINHYDSVMSILYMNVYFEIIILKKHPSIPLCF